MRGVWVATVANIDWPSQPGLSVKQQKREANEIIMHCKQLGLNAIFLQVRPASDVLYSSVLEPWSKVLTGQAGKNPRYDPLEYWVKQAHRQGIELHAWINPYRASMNLTDDLPQEHPYHTTPEMFVEYGNKLYYNPGHPKANIHINRVVKELLLNYDIDGLHMDDYFYPYPIQGQQFPDSTYYQRYGKGAFDQINDWRRANVNNTIRSIHATIESTKPWVQFGISPFGVWRNRSDDPRGSDTKAGTSNYDGLYADVLTWMENKWVDYIAPQIYWGTSHPLANYNVLASWWNNNHYDVPVYIGHGIYKIGSDKPDWQDQRQLPKQMEVVRNASNLSGSIFFSYKHLKRNLLGLQDSLMTNFYKSKSVVPSGASGEAKAVNGEVTKLKANKRRIKWKYVGDNKGEPLKYLIYKYHPKDAFQPDNPDFIYDVSYKSKYKLPKRQSKSTEEFLIRVTVLNAYNEEGTICAPVLLRY
ncbi:glycoside hydrolase family 10 protein [Carboxylicivirga taeanensis]|uniref:glycoside hydrolase family 10 protein n=1 Tax=Carboxylicivirga taeanensis TaxID=1416875 RepID=UPI003F6DDA93